MVNGFKENSESMKKNTEKKDVYVQSVGEADSAAERLAERFYPCSC